MKKRIISILCDFVPENNWTFAKKLSVYAGCECDIYSKSLNRLHGSFFKNLLRTIMYVVLSLKWIQCYKKSDVVIAWQQFFGIGMAFWLRLFHIRKKANIIVMTFIYKPKMGLLGKIYRRFIDYAVSSDYISRLVVCSSSEVKLYSEELGILVDKIVFIPYFLPEYDTPEVDPELAGRNYVFSTGRSNRDYDSLISAATMLGYEYIVACDELQNRNYAPNIEIISNIYDDKMRRYMFNSTIVAVSLKNPDVSSGQLVFLQAMQFGKVIMCTDCPTVRDYLEDGRNAILVKTPEQWPEEIDRVMKDTELRLCLSKTARNDYQSVFSMDKFTQKIAFLL